MPTKVDHWQKNAGFTSASVKTVPVGAELKTAMSLNDRKIKTKNRKYDGKYCGKFFESVAGATSGDEEYA